MNGKDLIVQLSNFKIDLDIKKDNEKGITVNGCDRNKLIEISTKGSLISFINYL